MQRGDIGETTSPILKPEDALTRIFRSPRRDRYARETVLAIRRSGDEELTQLADKMDQCCTSVVVRVPLARPEEARLVPNRCWSRVCPMCAAARGAAVARRVENLVFEICKLGRVPKFLTLTQTAKAGENWRAAYRRLRRALRRLSPDPRVTS